MQEELQQEEIQQNTEQEEAIQDMNTPIIPIDSVSRNNKKKTIFLFLSIIIIIAIAVLIWQMRQKDNIEIQDVNLGTKESLVEPEMNLETTLLEVIPNGYQILKNYNRYERAGNIIFGPYGRQVAYKANINEEQFIVIGEEKQTSYDWVSDPIFSPDGKTVAYIARRNQKWIGEKHQSVSEWVVVNGKKGKEYMSINGLMFSADGQLIYRVEEFVQESGESLRKYFVVVNGEEGNYYDRIYSYYMSDHSYSSPYNTPYNNDIVYTGYYKEEDLNCLVVNYKEVVCYNEINDLHFHPEYSTLFIGSKKDDDIDCLVIGGEEVACDKNIDRVEIWNPVKPTYITLTENQKEILVNGTDRLGSYDEVLFVGLSVSDELYFTFRKEGKTYLYFSGFTSKGYEFINSFDIITEPGRVSFKSSTEYGSNTPDYLVSINSEGEIKEYYLFPLIMNWFMPGEATSRSYFVQENDRCSLVFKDSKLESGYVWKSEPVFDKDCLSIDMPNTEGVYKAIIRFGREDSACDSSSQTMISYKKGEGTKELLPCKEIDCKMYPTSNRVIFIPSEEGTGNRIIHKEKNFLIFAESKNAYQKVNNIISLKEGQEVEKWMDDILGCSEEQNSNTQADSEEIDMESVQINQSQKGLEHYVSVGIGGSKDEKKGKSYDYISGFIREGPNFAYWALQGKDYFININNIVEKGPYKWVSELMFVEDGQFIVYGALLDNEIWWIVVEIEK